MGIDDDLNDLKSFNNTPPINNEYTIDSITAKVSVYEGPGTGGDSGVGVSFYNNYTDKVLQNGNYIVKLCPGTNTFSSNPTGVPGDSWEDKWVDIKYYIPLTQKEVSYHVHIGNNTPDAVLQFTVTPLNIPTILSENLNGMYLYGNVSSNVNEYFGSDNGSDNSSKYTYNDFFNDFRNQGNLPGVGNPLDWGDNIYNGINNALGGGWIGGFVGGVAEGLIGGTGMAIAGTGFAISKSAEEGSIDPLKYWGEAMIGGVVDTILTPYRAYKGEDITAREWGNFASIFVGIKGAKAGWKGIAKTGDYIRTRNLPKLTAERYIHPEAMDASKPTFPAAKNFEHLKNSFENAGNKVITFTPDRIMGDVVGDSRKGYLGLEDSGIYVAPKGKGNPYFSRKADYSFSWKDMYEEVKKGVNIKWNPIDAFKEKWQKYGKTGRVYETQVNNVVEPPKEVLEQPGFSAVNKWGQENLVGTGNIRFTKRSMIGQGAVKKQYYKNPKTGKWKEEIGTREYEAVIDKGYKFVDEGPVGWIPYGGRRIIVNKFSLLDEQGKKVDGGYINEKGMMMNYDEFYDRLKDDANFYYYGDKYRINIDSSLHYIKPNYDYTISKEEYSSYTSDNREIHNNHDKDSDYTSSYVEDYNAPSYSDYPTNTHYSIPYSTKTDYSSNTKYHPNYPPTPPTYPPNPPTYPPTPPSIPPIIPTPPSYPTMDSYYKTTQSSSKKKRKKKDDEDKRVKYKKYKQGVAKSKRSWYVKDINKAFKDVEKQAKELEKLMRF